MKITSGKAEELGKYEQVITIQINKDRNGLELSFRFKPNAAERAILKRGGYKWHYQKMVWYATNTPDHAAVISTLQGTKHYPDGWNAPDQTAHPATVNHATEKAASFEDWFNKHATAVLKAAAADRPDFMELSETDQSDIYMSAARTMYQYAA